MELLYIIIITAVNSSTHDTNDPQHQLFLGHPRPGPHGHVHVEMCSVHGQEIEGGQANQGGGGHEVEVHVVSHREIPEHGKCKAKDWYEISRHIQIPMLCMIVCVTMCMLPLSMTMSMSSPRSPLSL